MPITPSTVTLEGNQTQQFVQTGIGSPVWCLRGIGTLNQSGFYTAPGTGGSAIVEAATDFWYAYNNANLALNDDDSLTIYNVGYFQQAESNATLNNVGDYFEVEAYEDSIYLVIVTNAARTRQFGIFAEQIYDLWDGSGGAGSSTTNVLGDIIRIEKITGNFLRLSKNGVTVATSTNAFNFPVRLELSATNIGATIKKPIVGGTGIANYTVYSANVTVTLPILLPRTNLELYCEPHLLTLSNGANVLSLTDQSAHFRHLTAASSYPTFHTAVVNGKSVVRFNGSQNPLKNTANFTVSCGWIVAKFNGSTFSDYQGLLSDLVNQTILVSNNSGTNFFNTQIEFFEFRSNDRIYPLTNAPAPMNAWKLIFFRFWNPMTVDGIQIGQQTTFTARKANADIGFLALYSCNFHETEIRKYSKILADNFALTLADVYPYQADISDTPESINQSVNFYDPPEGDRISEVVGTAKRTIDLQFSVADQTEVKTMKTFHAAHYAAAVPFLYRDYRFTPPEDVEGYFDSQYALDGANNNFNYGFKFKEK